MCMKARFDSTKMNALRAQGFANAQIAERLGCSYQTVLRHIGEQSPELSDARRMECVRHAHRMRILNRVEAERQETQKRIIQLEERRNELRKTMKKLDRQLELENLRLHSLRA